ncbi:MAG: glycosyltransferase family 4 protein [Acidimicrobiia bacterium]
MRVLNVIDSLSGSGGAERGLVREITRFGVDVEQTVVLLYDRTDLAPELTARGMRVEVVGLAEGSGSRAWPRALGPVRSLARSVRPDVVQTSLFLGNIVGQVVGRSLRIPVVSNLVLSGDLDSLRAFQPGADTRRARILRSIAGWAARSGQVWFRALTEDVKWSNSDLLGVDPGRVTVIPRGVPEPDLGSPASREDLGLPAGPLVVNVGRLAPQKGQVHLVEAFAEVRRRVPDAHLVLVGGDGPAKAEVVGAIDRLGLAGAVTIAGYSTRVTDYLAHAHVFAFPSVMEGLGTSVVEAMACGVPVVAFDIPPVREATVGGEYGTLVPVGDVAALASALTGYVEADRVVDARARDWARAHHDLGRIATEVESLLRMALSESRKEDRG